MHNPADFVINIDDPKTPETLNPTLRKSHKRLTISPSAPMTSPDAEAIAQACLNGSLEDVPFDHDTPRGKSKLPAGIRTFFDVSGRVANDLIETPAKCAAYYPPLILAKIGQCLLGKKEPSEHERTNAALEKLGNDSRVNWDAITDSDGILMPVEEAKGRVRNALQDQPNLTPCVEQATEPGLKKFFFSPFRSAVPAMTLAQELARAGNRYDDIEASSSRTPLNAAQAEEIEGKIRVKGSALSRAGEAWAGWLENAQASIQRGDMRPQVKDVFTWINNSNLFSNFPKEFSSLTIKTNPKNSKEYWFTPNDEQGKPMQTHKRCVNVESEAGFQMAHTIDKLLPTRKQVPLDQQEAVEILESGKNLSCERPFMLGLLKPGEEENFKVHSGPFHYDATLPVTTVSNDSNFRIFLAALKPNAERLKDLVNDKSVVAVDMRGPDFEDQVFNPTMKDLYVKDTRAKNGGTLSVDGTAVWPLAKGILSEGRDGVGERGKAIYDRFAAADLCRVVSDNKPLQEYLNELVRKDRFTPARVNIGLMETLQKYNMEQVEVAEAIGDCFKGAIVGCTGEAIIDKVLPEVSGGVRDVMKSGAYWGNIALSGGVDAYDNISGRIGAAKSDIANKGFGSDDGNGQAKRIMRDAVATGCSAAAAGTVIAVGTMLPLSTKNSSPLARAADMLPFVYGSSLSIPIEFGKALPKKMAAISEQTRRCILLPPTADKAEATFRQLAIEDMMMGVGPRSSAHALSQVGLLALLPLPEYAKKSFRKVLQPLAFGIGPAFENLLGAGHMYRINNGFEESASQARTNVLTAAASDENTTAFVNNIRTSFAGTVAPKVGNFMNVTAYPIQLLANRGEIDYSSISQPVLESRENLPGSERGREHQIGGLGKGSFKHRHALTPTQTSAQPRSLGRSQTFDDSRRTRTDDRSSEITGGKTRSLGR